VAVYIRTESAHSGQFRFDLESRDLEQILDNTHDAEVAGFLSRERVFLPSSPRRASTPAEVLFRSLFFDDGQLGTASLESRTL